MARRWFSKNFMLFIVVGHLNFVHLNQRVLYPLTNFMKRIPVLLLCLFSLLQSIAQPEIKEKKYPSLLWEISGKGMKTPSYLIGTMHVSNKLAFHLPDSFYQAVRNAQVVALETNPETWQEDMSKYDLSGEDRSAYSSFYRNYSSMPADYLSIHTLKFYKYDKKIERALYSNPSAINNLLYRTYGNDASDFEEDTYLDMYIFQCGKKWGKKITGVEKYGESMKLMAEAYRDAAKDKNKKDRSYGDWDEAYSSDKLQDAYRLGNLDLLDSINKYNSFSAAFDEKFLYRRNQIQANSIDSILRSGATLFVGVGAAHLPGNRGVIELLRARGYQVRPVKMGERASKEKDLVDKMRVQVVFNTQTSGDGLFQVDIPGKFYKFGDDAALDQQQYADMANGSYYMVTRIMTNAWMWDHSAEDVYHTVDSLLYENIPGKIISKTTIYRNGYKGFDILNRTRRGDLQRYNIFITPFEVIFFKMSGNGDYIRNGNEAEKFFGSILLKEYAGGEEASRAAWKKYSPPYGGFAVDLPHEPFIGNDGSWIYDAGNDKAGIHYRVIRTDIHNYHFVEEDTFDLRLMEESFMASEFIDTQLLRRPTHWKGYPALEGKYRDKSGQIFLTRFIIQGPHYYTLIAHGKQEMPSMYDFLNSFEIKPFVYGEPKPYKNSLLYFTVNTPVSPEEKKIKLNIPRYSWSETGEEEDQPEQELLEAGVYRNQTISNDSTGEKIYISFFHPSRYYYKKDSVEQEDKNRISFFTDTTFVYRSKTKTVLPGNMKLWEAVITDTGSSRTMWTRIFYKNGTGFMLVTESDTLTQPSAFINTFFNSFTPADTLKGINPFVKKSQLFFEDFMSPDTVFHKRAALHIDDIELDSADLPQLKKAIGSMNWNEKKYLDTKTSLINKLGQIKTMGSADYLRHLYDALEDTVQLQYAVLENLLEHKTGYAFNLFRDIINTEPPVLESADNWNIYSSLPSWKRFAKNYESRNGNFLDGLFDSLQLTRKILPDLLPLLNLEDYRNSIMKLLSRMIDSNLLQPADYEMYFSKFLLEARQALKKQGIAEKKKSIEKAEESKTEKTKSSYSDDGEEKDAGNADLSLYATLLLPFQDKNPAVSSLLRQMLRSDDKRLKYNTMMLLLDKNKSYPDSLLIYFAGLDDYRYELYSTLREQKKTTLFPSNYNNHLDLGRSALMDKKLYDKPDTLLYLARLGAEYKDHKGFIYFYKYKMKKDDLAWKIAAVGLVPEDPSKFEFEDTSFTAVFPFDLSSLSLSPKNSFDFTGFSETKLKEDEPQQDQLKKELKKMLYSRRSSARQFYSGEITRSSLISVTD